MSNIASVTVELDDSNPEYMDGIIRISSVISYDENDKEIDDHQDLVDNTEFNSHSEVKTYVAKHLDIDKSIININD
ncbi:Uncharacterised protein [Aeromonas salmonicida]|uniref:hypothetical protein n=1 Tax=Aeromonas salmonicida TaxID=645 RepID=UPI001025E742|nr:hypothetical protein [Aeromonas salmonicida]VFB10072.1 Uncharacterised protein [Aeromonas salmonicida]